MKNEDFVSNFKIKIVSKNSFWLIYKNIEFGWAELRWTYTGCKNSRFSCSWSHRTTFINLLFKSNLKIYQLYFSSHSHPICLRKGRWRWFNQKGIKIGSMSTGKSNWRMRSKKPLMKGTRCQMNHITVNFNFCNLHFAGVIQKRCKS